MTQPRGRYAEYLRSPEWKALARQARERAGHRCECCGAAAEHVHHVRYPKRLSDDAISNLLVLCASCHAKQHGIRSPIMTTSKMLAIDGYRLCFTQHNGTPVVRYEDCMLAFGLRPENIHGRRWESCASRMTEGVHWFRLENPFTRQMEPFLTIAGFGITAVGHCRDEVLQKRITQSMAEAWEREVLGEPKLQARTEQALTPAWLMVKQAEELARLDDEQRAIIKRQEVIDSILHEVDDRQQKLNERLVAIEREKEDGRLALEETINADRFTCRQRLIMRGIDPEALWHGKKLKVIVGKIASKIGQEKRVTPQKIMEGTYEVNVWPGHIVDDAIRSLGLH